MRRLFPCVGIALLAVAGCGGPPPPPALGPNGEPIPRAHHISESDTGEIEYRMLDAVNALRQADGAPRLALDASLNAAAATHSRDMAVQNRPWHFGSDGSSPLERVRRSGYRGELVGENISETYETEMQTLAAWLQDEGTRQVILSPEARDMGLALFQEESGKIWWTLVTGKPTETPRALPQRGPTLGSKAPPS